MTHDAHNLFEYAGCSTALARTDDPRTSKVAAQKLVDSGALSRQEKMVFDTILGYIKNRKTKPDICNPHDFTTKDIAATISYRLRINYYKAYDICRKRFSGLSNKFKITLTGEQRDGCRVWRVL